MFTLKIIMLLGLVALAARDRGGLGIYPGGSGAGDAVHGGRPRRQAFGCNLSPTPLAFPVGAAMQARQGFIERFERGARRCEEGGDLCPLEGDGRPFGIVLIIGVGTVGIGDDVGQ